MPKSTVRAELDISTSSAFNKAAAKVTIEIDGREIPNVATIGRALDEAVKTVQTVITESYVTVPPRV